MGLRWPDMSLPVSALRGSCMPTTTAPPRYGLGKSWAGRGRAAGVCAAANKELQASVDPAPMKVVAPERFVRDCNLACRGCGMIYERGVLWNNVQ